MPRFQGNSKQKRSGFQTPFTREKEKAKGTPSKAMYSAIGMSSKRGAILNDAAIAPKLLDGDRLFVLIVYTIAPNAPNEAESMGLRGYEIEEVRDYTIFPFDLKEYRLGPQQRKQKVLTKGSIGAGEFGKEGFEKRQPKVKELEVGGSGMNGLGVEGLGADQPEEDELGEVEFKNGDVGEDTPGKRKLEEVELKKVKLQEEFEKGGRREEDVRVTRPSKRRCRSL